MIVEMAKYLSECHEFSGRQVRVNYLAEDEGSVSLEVSGNRESIKGYADGGVIKGVTFTLSVRDSFAVSQRDNFEVAERCHRIERWVEEQNLKGILPEIDSSVRPLEVGIVKRFRIVQTQDFLARYEAEIELIYCTV